MLIGLGLAFFVNALAQQNPDDPGIQDSIIVQTVEVNEAMRSVLVDIYFVTDDSVMYFNLPLRWTAENDSIYADNIIYDDIWGESFDDTINPDQHTILVCGFGERVLNTNGVRQRIMSIQFQVSSQISQTIGIDSTWDNRNGSVMLGLSDGETEITPAFVAGGIIYHPMDIGGENNQTPTAFTLFQNYPNPFNAQTTIRYSLSASGPVTLTIYNLLGQKVATLFDGIQAAGEHAIVWDAGNQSSGVCYYLLQYGKLNQVRKGLLIR